MKKEWKIKGIFVVLILLLVVTLVPSFLKRIENERRNDNVVVSLYYRDLMNRFSEEEIDKILNEYYELGVKNVLITEEDVNVMSSAGKITHLTYSSLCHKYDDESIELAKIIKEKVDKISDGTQLLLTKDKEVSQFVRKGLLERMSSEEYLEIEANNEMTVFCVLDETTEKMNMILGYDETIISKLYERGFEICLDVRMQKSGNAEYLKTLEDIIRKYEVKYLSLRSAGISEKNFEQKEEHHKIIADIVEKHNMTLVLTETSTHLSNEKIAGFDEVFEKNDDKVVRAYGFYAVPISNSGNYLSRCQEYVNSTIDRNIRFIALTQLSIPNVSYEKLNQYTFEIARAYINQLENLGYTVNGEETVFDYEVNLVPIDAMAAAIMVLMCFWMLAQVFEYQDRRVLYIGIGIAVLGALITLLIPKSLRMFYPTVWSVIMSCFAITAVFAFIKKNKTKIHTIWLAIEASLLTVVIMAIGGIVMSSMVSGIEYYMNNDIFRGVKLSLLVPVMYGLIIYYLMFLKDNHSVIYKIKKIMMSDIKVYWLIIAVLIGAVGYVYIRRSGNVNSISPLELAMRNFLTEVFTARPRTKEFMVGYPCLILFVYYIQKTDVKLIQAVLAMGSTILFASVSNSFCHVFTDVTTIYMRVFNGLLIGLIVSVCAYVLNLMLVKIVRQGMDYINKMDI